MGCNGDCNCGKEIQLNYEKLDASLPDLSYSYETDGCFDIRSSRDIVVWPKNEYPTKVYTGIRFNIPMGYEIQVRSRSGICAKNGVTVANSPGTIDQSYTGELIVLMNNNSYTPYIIKKGDRIAQCKLAVVSKVKLNNVKSVEDDVRGANGFGSTGVN